MFIWLTFEIKKKTDEAFGFSILMKNVNKNEFWFKILIGIYF